MSKSSSKSARVLAIVLVAVAAFYVLAYGFVRKTHGLVRYESGCILRGGLEGRNRDYWDWPYRCSELRRLLAPSEPMETIYAPLVAMEEVAREPRKERPSVCSLPDSTMAIPSQGLLRPAFCGH